MNQDDLDLLTRIFGAVVLDVDEVRIMNGTVVKVMGDKRFGFLRGDDGIQYFFHSSDVAGFFDDLVADVEKGQQIRVRFQVAPSTKGPRASEVTRLDGGVVMD